MRNWVRNHERISAAIVGLLAVITMVWRLGANATTPGGFFLIVTLTLIVVLGFYFGLRFGPRRS